jgi:hypothetical protein
VRIEVTAQLIGDDQAPLLVYSVIEGIPNAEGDPEKNVLHGTGMLMNRLEEGRASIIEQSRASLEQVKATMKMIEEEKRRGAGT